MELKSVQEDEIKEILKTLLSEMNVNNYEVILSQKSENGEGYMGDVIFVSVKTLSNFVIKCEKRNQEIRNLMPVEPAFSNELFCYKKLFPKLEQFEKQKQCLESTFKTPFCYKTIDDFNGMKVIILDNLKTQGYKMCSSQQPLAVDHIKVVLKNLARFHALGLAYRMENPEEFGQFAQQLDDVYAKIQKNCSTIRNKISEMVESVLVERNIKNADQILSLFKDSVKHLADTGDVTNPLSVIIHGDCWINNLLFNYDIDQNPLSVVFLDWQMTKVASPMVDVSFFLFSSCYKEQIAHFDEFLNVYYKSASDFLRELGHDPEQFYSHEVFMQEWVKYSKYGLLMMPILLTFCYATSDESIDFLEFARKKIIIEEELLLQVMENRKEEYLDRVSTILEFYGEELDKGQ